MNLADYQQRLKEAGYAESHICVMDGSVVYVLPVNHEKIFSRATERRSRTNLLEQFSLPKDHKLLKLIGLNNEPTYNPGKNGSDGRGTMELPRTSGRLFSNGSGTRLI